MTVKEALVGDPYDKKQEKMGAFLFLLALALFGVFSVYLWFS